MGKRLVTSAPTAMSATAILGIQESYGWKLRVFANGVFHVI